MQVQQNVYQAQVQICRDQIHDPITNRPAHCVNDPGKDKITMIIEKLTIPENDEFYEFPYCTARIQRQFNTTKEDILEISICTIDS